MRAGRYCVTVAYGEPEVVAFRLRDVSLGAAVHVAWVFYTVGGVHEDFAWEEV